MSGTSPATVIHNAKINLLATLLNNAALAFVVAGLIAPMVAGQLQGGLHALATLAWVGLGVALHIVARHAAYNHSLASWTRS
jgi:hypothetical protein